MRHTLTDSICRVPWSKSMCVPGRSYLCRLYSGEALLRCDHKQTRGRGDYGEALGSTKGGPAGSPAGGCQLRGYQARAAVLSRCLADMETWPSG